MIDLRSDTVTLPTAAMLATIADADLGDDVMGEDRTVAELESRCAELLGKQAGLLVPSGTMANQVAVMALTRRGQEVVVLPGSHIQELETGALATLSQVQPRVVDQAGPVPTVAEVLAALRPADTDAVQAPETGLVCLENAYDLNAGRVLPVELIEQIAHHSHAAGIPVYLDGARLFNAAAALGVDPAALCRPVDAVMVCLTKGLGAPVGSVLCGDAELIRQARKLRQRLGGGMRQAGIIAAPALHALRHHLDRIPEDHRRAHRLATGLARLAGVHVDPDAVRTSIVALRIDPDVGLPAVRFAAALREHGVLAKVIGPDRLRMITHLQVDDEAVDQVLEAVGAVLRRDGAAA
jgi:threonine aldolase